MATNVVPATELGYSGSLASSHVPAPAGSAQDSAALLVRWRIVRPVSEPREFTHVLERQFDGRWLIYVPELPGLATEGSTRDEAIEMLHDALPSYLSSMRSRDRRS